MKKSTGYFVNVLVTLDLLQYNKVDIWIKKIAAVVFVCLGFFSGSKWILLETRMSQKFCNILMAWSTIRLLPRSWRWRNRFNGKFAWYPLNAYPLYWPLWLGIHTFRLVVTGCSNINYINGVDKNIHNKAKQTKINLIINNYIKRKHYKNVMNVRI